MERILDKQISDSGGFILEEQIIEESPSSYEVNPRRIVDVEEELRVTIINKERRVCYVC